jgi:AbrB family looped-hinge helix DNA binding protein
MNKTASEYGKVGKRGALVIPAALRKRYRLEEGSLLEIQSREEGLLLRPVVAFPVETYSPERRAELLLANAVDAGDYAWAEKQVRALGLDPAAFAPKPAPAAAKRKRP